MAQAITLENDYFGITQEVAKKDIGRVKDSIVRSIKAIEGRELAIGQLLNRVKDSGLAVAAASDIDSNERDNSDDGRTTAVSSFVKTIEGLTSNDANRWQQHAARIGQAESAGFNTDKYVPSTFRDVPATATEEEFVAILTAVEEDDEVKKTTAAAIRDEGREQGIVPEGNVGGGGDPLQKAFNNLTIQLKKAETVTKKNITSYDAIVEMMDNLTA